MKLDKLLENIDFRSDNMQSDVYIKGISSDSRNITEGDLFIAIKGFESDGHEFVDSAVKNGAVAVVVEKNVVQKDVPVIIVDDCRKIKADIAGKFYNNPSQNLSVIGITGTNGKTTVTFLLESILKAQGIETGSLSTLLYKWKDISNEALRTTPDSIELNEYLFKMKENGVEAVVMEVSSHGLLLNRVDGLIFKAAVFTNLSRDHMDFHKTMKNYAETKSKLFSKLSKGGVGIINNDDPYSNIMRSSANGKVVSYGNKPESDYKITQVDYNDVFTNFTLVNKKKEFRFTTVLAGHFNVLNCAAAAVTGIELGCSISAVRKGIRSLDKVPGRMETVDSGKGFRIIIDYAHTPEAVENLITAVRKMTKKNVIIVIGCGGDRDKGKRPIMGNIASEMADRTIITSDNPRKEDPSEIISDMLKGIKHQKRLEVVKDRKQAIHNAIDIADEGDTVIIAGKGHETYQEIGIERIPFDDRKTAEKYLEQ